MGFFLDSVTALSTQRSANELKKMRKAPATQQAPLQAGSYEAGWRAGQFDLVRLLSSGELTLDEAKRRVGVL